MSTDVRTMELSSAEGRAWLESSLAGGFDVSAAVLTTSAFDRGRFLTFVSEGVSTNKVSFPDAPDVPSAVAERGLAEFFQDLIGAGGSSVVIEDDLAGPTDPGFDKWNVPSAIIGNRIVHWLDLRPGSTMTTVNEITTYCVSHRLNAFVSTRSSVDLGLVDRQPADENLARAVVGSLLAVIVFAFDETSFAVWDGR